MAMTIYGPIFSPFVARTVLAANAKGLKHKLEVPKDRLKSPEYLKLNPFGKVPVLVDGTTTLFESAVIVEYLDAKGKGKKGKGKSLVPKSAAAAAPVRLIAAIVAEYVQPAAGKCFSYWRTKSTDAAALETLKADLAKALDVLEKIMPKGKFAAGARFSLADVFAAPALFFSVHAAALAGVTEALGKRKKLNAYWKHIQKDKLAKPVLIAMKAQMDSIVAKAS
jgi:glutathione S-transferase